MMDARQFGAAGVLQVLAEGGALCRCYVPIVDGSDERLEPLQGPLVLVRSLGVEDLAPQTKQPVETKLWRRLGVS